MGSMEVRCNIRSIRTELAFLKAYGGVLRHYRSIFVE